MKRFMQFFTIAFLGATFLGCNGNRKQTPDPQPLDESPMSELSPNLAPSPAPELPATSADPTP